MDIRNSIPILKTLFKVVLIAAAAGAVAGAVTVWARQHGVALPDGVMMGIVIGVAGGSAAYFAKPRPKKG